MARYLGAGGNYITHKPMNILDFNRHTVSKTLPEAYMKYMKFYRDACRRMPYIVQSAGVYHMLHPTQAKLNLATHMRKNMYVRSTTTLDKLVTDGYEWLYETVWMYNHIHNFDAYVSNPYSDAVGRSYLDEKRYGGCSEFLKTFYSGKGKANY